MVAILPDSHSIRIGNYQIGSRLVQLGYICVYLCSSVDLNFYLRILRQLNYSFLPLYKPQVTLCEAL